FQVQGPQSLMVVEKAAGHALADIPSFRVGSLEIAGTRGRALNHLQSSGAGREVGMREVGGRAYPSMAIESGWLPSPTPAIFSGEGMREYRDWLGPDAWGAAASPGGTLFSHPNEDHFLP